MSNARRHTLFALFSATLGLVSAASLAEAVRYSLDSANVAASHIVLVPFVTLGLIVLGRNDVFRQVRLSPSWGGALVTAGLILRLLGEFAGGNLQSVDRLAIQSASIVTIWLGGFLLFYGAAAFRRGLFPLLFLFLAVPIPETLVDGIVTFLQRGTAEVTFVMLQATGTPVFRDGFVFAMPDLVIEIAPECSGIRSSIGMFIVSLLAGHTMLRTPSRKMVLVLAAVGIAVVKNAIRINTLSLLSVYVDPGIIDGRLHHEGGVVFFAVGLVLLYPVLALLARSESTVPEDENGVSAPELLERQTTP